MYSHDVHDIDDNAVPDDVAKKMICWSKGAIAGGPLYVLKFSLNLQTPHVYRDTFA